MSNQELDITQRHGLIVDTTTTDSDRLFERDVYKVKTADGENVLDTEYYREKGYYAVTWHKKSVDPDEFFQSVQRFIDVVSEMPNVTPWDGNPTEGLRLFRNGKEFKEFEYNRFTSFEELEVESSEVTEPHFGTPYGNFIFHQDGDKVRLAIISHVNAPGILTQFVMENLEVPIPGYLVNKLLSPICSSAGKEDFSSKHKVTA